MGMIGIGFMVLENELSSANIYDKVSVQFSGLIDNIFIHLFTMGFSTTHSIEILSSEMKVGVWARFLS